MIYYKKVEKQFHFPVQNVPIFRTRFLIIVQCDDQVFSIFCQVLTNYLAYLAKYWPSIDHVRIKYGPYTDQVWTKYWPCWPSIDQVFGISRNTKIMQNTLVRVNPSSSQLSKLSSRSKNELNYYSKYE